MFLDLVLAPDLDVFIDGICVDLATIQLEQEALFFLSYELLIDVVIVRMLSLRTAKLLGIV